MDSSHSPNTPNNTNSGPPPQQGGTSNGISASGSGEPTVGARNSSFGSSSEDEGRRSAATSASVFGGNTTASAPSSRTPGPIRSSTSQAPRHAPYPLPSSNSRSSTSRGQSSHPSNSTRGPRASNPPPQQGASRSMDPIEAMLFNVLNQDETPQTTARERFVAGLRQSGRTEEDIREIMEVYDRVH